MILKIGVQIFLLCGGEVLVVANFNAGLLPQGWLEGVFPGARHGLVHYLRRLPDQVQLLGWGAPIRREFAQVQFDRFKCDKVHGYRV